VQSVAKSDSVSVAGLGLGEQTLCISSGSGCSANVTVWVYDPKALMTGGLVITYTDQFAYRWHDDGRGYSQDGAFYHPIPPAGYYALGSIGQGTQVAKCNVGCRGVEAISCPQRAINHFSQKKRLWNPFWHSLCMMNGDVIESHVKGRIGS